MELVFVLSFFLIMLCIVRRKKKMDGFSRRLFYVYLAYWFLSFFLAALNPIGLNKIVFFTYFIVAVHIFFFWLGYSKNILIREDRNFDLDHLCDLVNRLLNNVIFRIILFVAIIYLASLVMIFYERMMFYQSVGDVRDDYYDYNLYGPFFGEIHMLLLAPLHSFVIVMLSVSLLKIRIFSWNNFILVIYTFLYNSLSGGRGGYLALVWGLIFIAFCVKNILKDHKFKFLLYSVPLISILFVFLSLVTAARLGDVSFSKGALKDGSETLSESLVTYTSGPLVAFDYATNHQYIEMVGGYKYGGFTLSAPIILYNIVGRRIGLEIHQSINDIMDLKQGTQFEIGDGKWYNALYTSCLWYYLDFGYLGLIIFPYLFGWLVRWVIKTSYKYQTLPMIVILYMAYNYTIKSVMDFYLNKPLILLTIIVIFSIGKSIARRKKVWSGFY